jgi:hypothetical protein
LANKDGARMLQQEYNYNVYCIIFYYTAVISNSFIGGGNQISWGILNWS